MTKLTRSLLLAAVCLPHFALAVTSGDPLQWLESPKGEKARAWAQQQTARTRARYGETALAKAAAANIKQALAQSAPEPSVLVQGDHLLRLKKDPEHPHGLLQWAPLGSDGEVGAWVTALDLEALRAKTGTAYELQTYTLSSDCLPPARMRCMLRLSPGGGDEVELREFDLKSGKFIANGFHVPKSRAFSVWMGPDQLLVESTADGEPKTQPGWPAQVRLWKRGEPYAQSKIVFTAKPSDAIVELTVAGEGKARRGVITQSVDYSTFRFHLVDAAGGVEDVDLPEKTRPQGLMALSDDHLVVQLGEPASVGGVSYPAETLLAYSLRAQAGQPRVTKLFEPGQGDYLSNGASGIAGSGDRVDFVVSHDLQQSLYSARWQGGHWQVAPKVFTAEPGQGIELSGAGNGDFVVSVAGFTTPRRQLLFAPSGSTHELAVDKPVLDPAAYVTDLRKATSADGTSIDYYLVHPRKLGAAPHPTLMTGYAAFGISVVPDYFGYQVGGMSIKPWLERGGSLAVVVARGGGERGEAWHRAAMREGRQHSYDDFIAVASQLESNGYTTPAHFGVFGSSNGGLLAATLGTERPDLFGAVVSDVPLTDLIRMRYMGMGAAWMDEYGNPDVPAERKAILAYSPYQNVHEGTQYPPFLVTTSTQDNRVGPGHARKMVARLQQVGAPAWLYEADEGGHGVSDAYGNTALMGLRMAFLISHLMP